MRATTNDSSPHQHSLLAPKYLAEPECNDRTSKASDIVKSYDSPEKSRVRGTFEVVNLEEVRGDDDTAENALVVAEAVDLSVLHCVFLRWTYSVMSVPHATVTQKVNHPPLRPKYGLLFAFELDLLNRAMLKAE